MYENKMFQKMRYFLAPSLIEESGQTFDNLHLPKPDRFLLEIS